jgi:hypothetical protein
MCRVYVLAGKLMDNDTSGSIAMRLVHLSKDYWTVKDCPSFEAVQVIYNGTPRDDTMRLVLIMAYRRCDDIEILCDMFDNHNTAAEIPPEFRVDLIRHFRYLPTQKLDFMTRERDLAREKNLDLTKQLAKLNTDHKETQAKLESTTKAFKDMKAQCNDAKAKVEANNEELRSKDRLIRERDEDIADKGLKIKNKDQAIKKKDQAIQALKEEQAAYNKHIIDKLIAATKKRAREFAAGYPPGGEKASVCERRMLPDILGQQWYDYR